MPEQSDEHDTERVRATSCRAIRQMTKRLDRIDHKVDSNYEQIQEQLAQIQDAIGENFTARWDHQDALIRRMADATGVDLSPEFLYGINDQ